MVSPILHAILYGRLPPAATCQDVAASCIFLATKTEECGRKLRDVAKVFYSKVAKIDINDISDDNKVGVHVASAWQITDGKQELETYQTAILLTEEALLEALCFDFVVDSPHAELVDLVAARQDTEQLTECAWSIANDTARTPLCVLFPSRIIAAACYILAQHVIEGPQSPSLDIRIASPAPSASLPTPPSHKVLSPETSRFAVEYFGFNEVELAGVAETLNIILEFYAGQAVNKSGAHLTSVAAIPPPKTSSSRQPLYNAFDPGNHPQITQGSSSQNDSSATPNSTHGGQTPAKISSKGWKPVGA